MIFFDGDDFFLKNKKKVIYLFFLSIFVNCSDQTDVTSQYAKIRIVGSFEYPQGSVSGSFEPITQTYSVQSILLRAADGSVMNLYNSDAFEVRISKRPLLVKEALIEEKYIGQSFTSFEMTVNQLMTASSKYEQNHQITLPSGSITLSDSIAIPKGQNLIFTIYVQWRGTVTRNEEAQVDTMVAPTYRVVFEKS